MVLSLALECNAGALLFATGSFTREVFVSQTLC